jgi:hypothetical protein
MMVPSRTGLDRLFWVLWFFRLAYWVVYVHWRWANTPGGAAYATPPPFDVDAARKAGHSDDDIIGQLSSSRGFDVGGAIKAGYSKPEIIQYLAARQPAPLPSNAAPSQHGQQVSAATPRDIPPLPPGFKLDDPPTTSPPPPGTSGTDPLDALFAKLPPADKSRSLTTGGISNFRADEGVWEPPFATRFKRALIVSLKKSDPPGVEFLGGLLAPVVIYLGGSRIFVWILRGFNVGQR